jgi:hypothetical protein
MARINPGVMQVDGGGAGDATVGKKTAQVDTLPSPVGEDDPRYYTVKVGSTGKTSAQLAALQNAQNTVNVINANVPGVTSVIDPGTGRVVTTKKAVTPTINPPVNPLVNPPVNTQNITDPAVLALIQSLNAQIQNLTNAQKSAQDLAAQQATLAAAEKAKQAEQQRQSIVAVLTDRFQKYGLGSLINQIKDLAIDGATESTITFALQESEEY